MRQQSTMEKGMQIMTLAREICMENEELLRISEGYKILVSFGSQPWPGRKGMMRQAYSVRVIGKNLDKAFKSPLLYEALVLACTEIHNLERKIPRPTGEDFSPLEVIEASKSEGDKA